MLDLETAIKHCEEVAEENDLAAGMYEILAENNHNAYEKLTAETNSSRCTKCAEDHKQLSEWLTELRDLRVKVKQMEKDYVELEEINSKHMWETDNLLDEIREDYRTIMELKKFLIIAMNDMETIYEAGKDEGCYGVKFKWRYEDKALQLIGDDYNDVVKMIGDELCGKNDND